jgi:monofunctional biosynthetic peptidoglycan transglycosylase
MVTINRRRQLRKPGTRRAGSTKPPKRSGRGRAARSTSLVPLATILGVVIVLSVVLILPWRWMAPPTTAFMIGERVSGEGGTLDHRWIPWERIAPAVAIAVVASEDQKFPTHHGFDLQSMSRALEESDGRPRGASTISQQVAKNLFLWRGRSLVRKGLEAYLTLYIEALWPKRRILEVYLNVAEFGPGVYGVGAASARYFGKSPDRLTLDEGALLAAALPSPRRMSVTEPSDYVRKRVLEIKQAVEELGGVDYLAGL